ncbi:ABC transporter ATP-binding protein [Magnetovibrio sp. PR-2]|uniref:ABC transporter ATP-binding protein n=1 Tax=Magnetovibrio sp. PR-2 TaxID=3120356 RepID=UPI002FCE07AD
MPDMQTTSSSAIHLNDVHLRLNSDAGEVNILRGINLDIARGETIGLVGPSGSGKTSLLMVIAGLERASAGQIQVAGNDITNLSEDQLALFRREHTGIVFQNFHLVPTMTALENVALPLEFAGRKHAFEAARDQLDAVGLSHRLEHYPGQLSGGEQQRVALARAFVTEPTLLLADEPTGNLDGKTGETVMELLFDLHKRKNTTLVLITHAPVLAEQCSRILTMLDGEIVNDAQAGVSS